MAQQGGVVASVGENGWARVLMERKEAHAEGGVSSCCKPSGPGARMVVKAANRAGAETGDFVALDLGFGAVIKSALLLYFFPVIGLVLGAVLGALLGVTVGMGETAGAIVLGVSGMGTAFWISRRVSNRVSQGPAFTPVITTVLKKSVKSSDLPAAVDPVCHMAVDPKKAAATFEYKGKTYYFCHSQCKKSFAENPEKYR